jgi:transposase InsO family protein
MPWKETSPVQERMRFVLRWCDEEGNFSALCREFKISRKTGYKWLDRFEQGGASSLEDRAPIAGECPHRTPEAIRDRIVEARKRHPSWGPRKLRAWLAEREPKAPWPAMSTISELLKRNGLIRPRKRRLRVPIKRLPLAPCDGPNEIWSADFKGHFPLGDRRRCYPLTIVDAYSRYFLKCEALLEPKEDPVRLQFELAFREFGLPKRIRTDNGVPFASTAIGGLTGLAVWFVKLGIVPERIAPGHPEQNGRIERLHRTLKAEATKPPGADITAQQRTFDRFRHEYNDERPHESLEDRPPARVYALSLRPFQARVARLRHRVGSADG